MPATCDLFTLIYGSSSQEITLLQCDELIYVYYMELEKNLVKLQYENKIPSLADIHVSMAKVGIHIVLITLYIVALRNIKGTHDDIFQKFLENDDANKQYRIDFFTQGNCQAFKFLIKFFNFRGYLDNFN